MTSRWTVNCFGLRLLPPPQISLLVCFTTLQALRLTPYSSCKTLSPPYPTPSHLFFVEISIYLNINWNHSSPSLSSACAAATLLCDIANDYSLQQMVSEPTRESNILDLVFTNKVNSLYDVRVVDNLPGTDHDAVLFAADLSKQRPLVQKRQMYNFKQADFNRYRELLNKVPWDCCFLRDSINDCWINFRNVLLSVADQCIPTTILRPKKRMYWLSGETLHLIRKKRRAYKLAKRSGQPHHFQRYRNISNELRSLTRQDHHHHLNQVMSNLHNDQRPFWRWLKNARGQRSRIPDLHHQGSTLSTPVRKPKPSAIT